MNMKNGPIDFNVPDEYQQVKTMPEDPPLTTALALQNANTEAMVLIYPIKPDSAMPFSRPQKVVDGIHRALGDDQGLIDVSSGVTDGGHKYIYSIVKSARQPYGVQYTLTLHLERPDHVLNVTGFFDESGMTGMRDAIIYEMMTREGKTDSWSRDPYDPEYKNGLLMNLSEMPKYDPLFPDHPLSTLRGFLKYMTENN